MWIRVMRQHVVICHILVKYFLAYCIRSVQKCKLPSVRLFHRAGSLIKLTTFAGCLLLDDSRTCVWTTCPSLLPESGTAGVQPATFCVASQHPNDYSMVPHGAHLSPISQHNSPNSYPPIQFSVIWIGELCCELGERWVLCGTILQHQAV